MTIGSGVLDKAITKIGSWVNINIGSESYNIYGDGSVSFTAFSGEGYIQVLTDIDESVRAGIQNTGDAVGYFRMNSTLPLGSRIYITHQGINYDIVTDVTIPHISGNQLLKTVNLRRRVN